MEEYNVKDGMPAEMSVETEAGEASRNVDQENPEWEDGDDIGMYVKFKKPYVFEDETFDGIDLSCLENLSTKDILEVEKRFYKLGVQSVNPEFTVAYAKIVVQKASGLPIEFFDGLPVNYMMKIKSRIVNFFFS